MPGPHVDLTSWVSTEVEHERPAVCLAGGDLNSYMGWHWDAQRQPFCMQEVTLSDAEDAIELFSFSLFGGSPEDAAMRDFRPPGCRQSSKQVKAGPFKGSSCTAWCQHLGSVH